MNNVLDNCEIFYSRIVLYMQVEGIQIKLTE